MGAYSYPTDETYMALPLQMLSYDFRFFLCSQPLNMALYPATGINRHHYCETRILIRQYLRKMLPHVLHSVYISLVSEGMSFQETFFASPSQIFSIIAFGTDTKKENCEKHKSSDRCENHSDSFCHIRYLSVIIQVQYF